MVNEKVIKKINEAITRNRVETESLVFSASSEADFFEKAIENYRSDDYKTIFKLKNSDFLAICLKLYNDTESYISISQDVEKVATLLNEWTINTCSTLTAYITTICSKYEENYRALTADNDEKGVDFTQTDSYCYDFFDDDNMANLIKKYNCSKSLRILYSLIVSKYYASIFPELIGEADCSARTKRQMEDFLNSGIGKLDEKVSTQTIIDFKAKNIVIKEVVRYIKNHVNMLNTLATKANKIANLKIKNYQTLIKLIENGAIKKYTKIPIEIRMNIDDSIALLVNAIISDNINDMYHSVVYDNQKLLERNATSELKKYLIELGINYENISPQNEEILYLCGNLDKIKEITKYFTSIGVEITDIFNSDIVYFFCNADLNNLRIIETYKQSNIIDNNFIKNNLGILLTNSCPESPYKPLFNNIVASINYLTNKKLKLSFPDWDRNILLIPIEELEYRNALLVNYDLNPESHIYMLSHIDQIWLIDMMLENNINLNLCSQICLNYDSLAVIKKILLSNSIGENYLTSRGVLNKTVNGYNNFYVDDKELDDSIENDTPDFLKNYENQTILSGQQITDLFEQLDAKYLQANIYVLGNLQISKNKVMKKIIIGMTITDLVNALLFNTFATYDQIEELLVIISKILNNCQVLAKK